VRADVVLAGGGLAGGLIALALAEARPELSVVVVEAGATLGGNHTWSFHTSDVTAAQLARLCPLIARSWPSHHVLFRGHRRELASGYHAIRSDRFHRVLVERLGDRVRLGARIASVAADRVILDGGEVIEAGCVIDARGFPAASRVPVAYQKFHGMELTLAAPHGLGAPILMDARVEQEDGYRFVYVLPFDEVTLLVEDTRYSDGPALDVDAMRAAIRTYAGSSGWQIAGVAREESGVLPLPLSGSLDEFSPEHARVPRAGVRAGLFHATTGYSLPHAVRFADALAALPALDAAAVLDLSRREGRAGWERGGFFRLLNRMLFRAADPGERRRVFEKFYRQPEDLIQRFYAGRLRPTDILKIFSGRPPVSVWRAVREVIV
jgi:lycopene beta-cyclase